MIGRLVARVRLQALLPVFLAGLWVAGSLAGCTNVRPTIKIGVLAPFEGLHRRSGYAALEAVRAAIADFSNVDAGILPLALDDGDQPQQAVRSAQKLLADPRVAAVVGPLSPDLGAAVEPFRVNCLNLLVHALQRCRPRLGNRPRAYCSRSCR